MKSKKRMSGFLDFSPEAFLAFLAAIFSAFFSNLASFFAFLRDFLSLVVDSVTSAWILAVS